ncbi:hypothetical protein TcasGA2_TC032899 [Tribolium castaneum]|uniref:Uncharacterized protein n=1 Tax=Tribolium castaneum TaxID=7070 RepID=A0A139WJP5_TRICA|nr:hypothetical protein TcasGA2_TC032899 [Tribolium castaneum]
MGPFRPSSQQFDSQHNIVPFRRRLRPRPNPPTARAKDRT